MYVTKKSANKLDKKHQRKGMKKIKDKTNKYELHEKYLARA